MAVKLHPGARRADAMRIADRYATGSCRDDLEYEITVAINLAVADLTGLPPGPVSVPKTLALAAALVSLQSLARANHPGLTHAEVDAVCTKALKH